MPLISQVYFRIAIVFMIIGVSLGLKMAVTHDFDVVPVHVHVNLLGWVTCAIFGVYYALNPLKAESRLAWAQIAVYMVGLVVMLPALYLMITGVEAVGPVVAVFSFVTFGGVLLFAAVVFSPQAAGRNARLSAAPAE